MPGINLHCGPLSCPSQSILLVLRAFPSRNASLSRARPLCLPLLESAVRFAPDHIAVNHLVLPTPLCVRLVEDNCVLAIFGPSSPAALCCTQAPSRLLFRSARNHSPQSVALVLHPCRLLQGKNCPRLCPVRCGCLWKERACFPADLDLPDAFVQAGLCSISCRPRPAACRRGQSLSLRADQPEALILLDRPWRTYTPQRPRPCRVRRRKERPGEDLQNRV